MEEGKERKKTHGHTVSLIRIRSDERNQFLFLRGKILSWSAAQVFERPRKHCRSLRFRIRSAGATVAGECHRVKSLIKYCRFTRKPKCALCFTYRKRGCKADEDEGDADEDEGEEKVDVGGQGRRHRRRMW